MLTQNNKGGQFALSTFIVLIYIQDLPVYRFDHFLYAAVLPRTS